jgi:hypothetical protein
LQHLQVAQLTQAQTLRRSRTSASFIVLALGVAAACSRTPGGERPVADYDQNTGRLRRIVLDANKNGKNDTVSYMDGTRIIRVELDLDENGKVERWDFYGPDGTLEKVGFASRNDGVMDSQAFYEHAGVLRRIESSTKRDGRFDRTEFYEHNVLVRSEDDTNGDGRPDKWDVYTPRPDHGPGEPAYAIASTEFDDSGSGRPERRFVYGPKGSIARVEFDRDGTGNWRSQPVSVSK